MEHVPDIARQRHYFIILNIIFEANRALFVRVFRFQFGELDLAFLEFFEQAWDSLIILASVDLDQKGHQVRDQRGQTTALAHGGVADEDHDPHGRCQLGRATHIFSLAAVVLVLIVDDVAVDEPSCVGQ